MLIAREKLLKSLPIIGKNVQLRLVELSDASFIVDLRSRKGQFLSTTPASVNQQEQWLEGYFDREKLGLECYFIIENVINKIRIGTARIYEVNLQERSFTFGSFIVDKNLAIINSASFEAMNLVIDFAFTALDLEVCNFDCRKNNDIANNFYRRFGSVLTGETELDYLYQIINKNYNAKNSVS